jgi:hypothetical protein
MKPTALTAAEGINRHLRFAVDLWPLRTVAGAIGARGQRSKIKPGGRILNSARASYFVAGVVVAGGVLAAFPAFRGGFFETNLPFLAVLAFFGFAGCVAACFLGAPDGAGLFWATELRVKPKTAAAMSMIFLDMDESSSDSTVAKLATVLPIIRNRHEKVHEGPRMPKHL